MLDQINGGKIPAGGFFNPQITKKNWFLGFCHCSEKIRGYNMYSEQYERPMLGKAKKVVSRSRLNQDVCMSLSRLELEFSGRK